MEDTNPDRSKRQMDDAGGGPSKYQQAKAILQAALDTPADQRSDLLDEACAGDPQLRAEVDSLLESEADADTGFLRTPPMLPHDGIVTDSETDADGIEEPDLLGRRVGAYRLERLLGRGGMGAVYLASRDDGEFEKRVAIKFIRPSLATPTILQRFRTERQILADFEHPNIARLLDGGTADDGRPYLIMEFVEGESLAEALNRGPLSVDAAVRLAKGVAEALRALHSRDLVFRDLKPSNVMFTGDGQVKVLDFGIAKIVRNDPDESGTGLTAPGWIIGSPNYMAPEQALGGPVDQRADVFSFGVLLFHALTGRLPFDGESSPEYLHNLIHAEPRMLPASVPSRLQKLVERCLRKNPARRIQSGEDLVLEVRSISRRAKNQDDRAHGAIFGWPAAVALLTIFAVVVGARMAGFFGESPPSVGPSTAVATWTSAKMDPRISPDGKWLSFISDHQGEWRIWLRSADGEEERIIAPAGGSLIGHVWSPDSDRIAYLTTTSSRTFLYVVSISADGERETHDIDVADASLVRWIGDRIYLLGINSMWRYDLETRQPVQIMTPPAGSTLLDIDVREDEERIVFTAFAGLSSLWVADLDGSNPEQLTFEHTDPRLPRWIGDTDEIVYLSAQGGPIDVWHLRTATREPSQLTFSSSNEIGIDVARDGSLLLMLSITQNANLELLDPNAEPTRSVSLARDSLADLHPSASGNGQLIAFQRAKHLDGSIGVYETEVFLDRIGARPAPKRVADGYSPEISPNGRWIAYLKRLRPPAIDLWIYDIRENTHSRLRESLVNVGFVGFPFNRVSSTGVWSPRLPEFYFLAVSDGGQQQIRSVALPADDEEPRSELVFEAADPSDTLRDLRVSEDGTKLSYLVQSKSRARWELHEHDLERGTSALIYSETLGFLPRFLGPLTSDGPFVIVRFVSSQTLTIERAEVITVTRDGTTRQLGQLRDLRRGSVALDPHRQVLYFIRVEELIHRLFAFHFEDGRELLVHGGMQGHTFSGVRVLDDGRLLFSNQERNENLFVSELTR